MLKLYASKKINELCEILWKTQDVGHSYNLGIIFELGVVLECAAFPKHELVYMQSLVQKERWRSLLRRTESYYQSAGALTELIDVSKN